MNKIMDFRISLLLAGLVFLIGCGQTPQTNSPANVNTTVSTASTPATAATADPLAQGKKLYIDNCAACHKEDGRGGKIEIEGKSINPEDLTAAKIKSMPDDKIYSIVHKGIEDDGMPAFKDKLTEAQIREVVRYVRTEIQKMPTKPVSQ